MDAFIIFSLLCFVLYLQAGVYALWRNPNDGITHWFLIHILLYAIWSLSFVFSGMGPAAQLLFNPKVLMVIGLLLTPAFFVRIYTAFMRKPASQYIRNTLFFALFFIGVSILLYLLLSEEIFLPWRFTFFDDVLVVSTILALLFIMNVVMFIQLHVRVLRPRVWSHEIIQGLRQILIICGIDMSINYANQYTLEVLGKTMEDIYGKQLGDLFVDPDDLNQKAGLVKENNSPGSFTCLLKNPGSSHIPVGIEIIKLIDAYQDVDGLAIIGEDLQKMKSLNDLIASYEKDISELNMSTNDLELLVKEFSVRLAKLNDGLNEQYQKAQLVEELVLEDHAEREWLRYEIHSRVIENMVLIATIVKSHEQANSDSYEQKKLDVLAGRIHALLLIHKYMYFSISYSAVDFKEFVYQLVGEQFEKYRLAGKLSVRLHLSESFLDIERAIPLGLILHELLLNAIIHAFDFLPYAASPGNHGPGQESNNGSLSAMVFDNETEGSLGFITTAPIESDALIMIEYTERADDILFVFEDNGKGIPPSYASDDFRSNGLVLIDVLVRDQLGGEINIDLSRGTRVMITIPKDALMQGR